MQSTFLLIVSNRKGAIVYTYMYILLVYTYTYIGRGVVLTLLHLRVYIKTIFYGRYADRFIVRSSDNDINEKYYIRDPGG